MMSRPNSTIKVKATRVTIPTARHLDLASRTYRATARRIAPKKIPNGPNDVTDNATKTTAAVRRTIVDRMVAPVRY
jgi:hypothetical protein